MYVSNTDYPCGTEFILQKFMYNDIGIYNDTHTHAEVLAAWDKAIAGCSKDSDEN
jgi:hypothetical protein